jgi:hypothetical protein
LPKLKNLKINNVVDTLADSYVLKSSEVSGFAAEMACKRKHSKYSSIISSNYVFKGLAFETLGPWCKEAIDFINVIGNRLIAESGDSKSIEIPYSRGNCHSTWKRCKHSGHFSKDSAHIIGNFCIIKQKCLCKCYT